MVNESVYVQVREGLGTVRTLVRRVTLVLWSNIIHEYTLMYILCMYIHTHLSQKTEHKKGITVSSWIGVIKDTV